MSISKNFIIKQKIISVLVLFSFFSFGGIIYTFHFSACLDKAHIKLVEKSEKIEIKVLDARINLDNYLQINIKESLDSSQWYLKKSKLYIIDVERMITDFRTYTSNQEKLILSDLSRLKQSISNLENKIKKYNDGLSINTSFDQFEQYFTDYEKSLHLFINETNSRLKQEIFILLLAIFIILIVSLLLIIRLTNNLIKINADLVRNTMKVEQRERRRIAMDLHDGLGALLSSIGIYGKILAKEFKKEPEALVKLNQISSLSKQALETVEEVINNLNPSVLNRYNLSESLEKLSGKINKLGKLNLTVNTDNLSGMPLKSTEVIVYRICNELINNSLRHAKASEAHLILSGYKTILIKYSDNGIGFDSAKINNSESGGMGLKNITDRISSIGGKLNIKSRPGKGFFIEIKFNINTIKHTNEIN
nr:histidine kinase [uncultured Marinifilum sp.]